MAFSTANPGHEGQAHTGKSEQDTSSLAETLCWAPQLVQSLGLLCTEGARPTDGLSTSGKVTRTKKSCPTAAGAPAHLQAPFTGVPVCGPQAKRNADTSSSQS